MKTNQWIGIGLFLMCLVITLPVVHAGTLNLQYDTNGNLITGDGRFRVYNTLNQLAEVRNGSASDGTLLEDYVYHPTEERILVKKVYEAGAVKDTVYYVDENFVRVVNSSGTYDYTYVKHEGQLVAQLNPDGTKYFVHGDHLGSTSAITDESSRIIENTTYTPHGEILSGGAVSRFDYTGKEYSTVVGDYDYNFRKLKPEWAIFTQPDSLLPNVYDPQQLNRYSYARNNPYTYKDENGHIAVAAVVLAGFFIFSVVVGVLAFIEVARTGDTSLLKRGIDSNLGKETGKDILGSKQQAEEIPSASENLQIINKAADNANVAEQIKINALDPQSIEIPSELPTLDDQKKKEENIPLGGYRKTQVDEKGQAYVVTFNKKGQEVSRTSTSSSSGRDDGSAAALNRYWKDRKAKENSKRIGT